MQSKAVLKTHADLVDRMAQTVGVDLEETMMEGRLSMDQLGDAVLACTGCSQPENCQKWLTATDSADTAPGYCRNGDTFDRLKAGKRA